MEGFTVVLLNFNLFKHRLMSYWIGFITLWIFSGSNHWLQNWHDFGQSENGMWWRADDFWIPLPANEAAGFLIRELIQSVMVKTTMVARVSDGLPLAASMDDEQVCLLAFGWWLSTFSLRGKHHGLRQPEWESPIVAFSSRSGGHYDLSATIAKKIRYAAVSRYGDNSLQQWLYGWIVCFPPSSPNTTCSLFSPYV
jgi:hypothetical protein